MAVKSVYVPGAARDIHSSILPVAGDEHRHLAVARVRPGEEVEVFDGRGRRWQGVVVDQKRSETRILLQSEQLVSPGTTEIVLAQSLVRNSVFDWIVEKAVEVGVSRIVPFRAERSNETGKGRERRWQRIVIEAMKQSKQYYAPQIDAAVTLDEVLAIEAESKVVLAESGQGNLKEALRGSPVLLAIGPEGGWTGSELDRMANAGFRQVHFGQQILRAETAAILAIGLVAYELGAL